MCVYTYVNIYNYVYAQTLMSHQRPKFSESKGPVDYMRARMQDNTIDSVLTFLACFPYVYMRVCMKAGYFNRCMCVLKIKTFSNPFMYNIFITDKQNSVGSVITFFRSQTQGKQSAT